VYTSGVLEAFQGCGVLLEQVFKSLEVCLPLSYVLLVI